MDEKKFCRFCGAHLREGAKFCTNCGAIITRLSTQPTGPPTLLSDIESLWRRFGLQRQKKPYKIVAGAMVGILILFILAAVAPTSNTANQGGTVQSTPVPSATPMKKITPTPSATPKPTTTPTPAPTSAPTPTTAALTDAQKVENSLSNGFVIITPFKKINHDGTDGYEGIIRSKSTGDYLDAAYFPYKTMYEAVSDLGIWKSIYQSNGYTTVEDLADMWKGVRYSDDSIVEVQALPNSVLDTPMLIVLVSK